MAEQDFTKAGFSVVGTENNENKLLSFLKENYPNVIRDTEINIEELKAVLGLPIDEKVNGYGLNFVGRNFARAKYAQKTEKELRLNNALSKDIDITQNLVLKGNNLDSLKILKNYYSGQIKCIYIDPPYNTEKDEFVYPDKFDKEETEVLGLANLSENDFERMDFSFRTKKSHNGWLAFMYPRLLLARDLLTKDGAIFISIDDNEQANIKLLCDDVFGEENLIAQIVVQSNKRGQTYKQLAKTHEYLLVYVKSEKSVLNELVKELSGGIKTDDIGDFTERELRNRNPKYGRFNRPNLYYPIYVNPNHIDRNGYSPLSLEKSADFSIEVFPLNSEKQESCWRWGTKKLINNLGETTLLSNIVARAKSTGEYGVYEKYRKDTFKAKTIWFDELEMLNEDEEEEDGIWDETGVITEQGSTELRKFGMGDAFDFPKPTFLLKKILNIGSNLDSICLDFFAGSGTTGQAVMELNKNGGKRKFILCQIDEPIKEDKPAYKFCIDNNLPPVISSITIERLKRAGEKIKKDIEEENDQSGLFEEDKKQVPDIGYKVFDRVEAPKLKVDDKGQISITENETDALSRIYNMIFTVGLDEPTQVPEEVVKDCIYKIGNHYYITNSEKITSDDYSNAIKNGKVFIDGWTASLNGTLQNYKEDVKIVF
ncbi:site-specific DNA-methyltransferase [Flavihumibacter sp.]|uniref:site-specific DNA-methyltransferase n=1 Tax=Flavihumibacter sp. TaxID=1913981 RepID=UPI002FC68580